MSDKHPRCVKGSIGLVLWACLLLCCTVLLMLGPVARAQAPTVADLEQIDLMLPEELMRVTAPDCATVLAIEQEKLCSQASAATVPPTGNAVENEPSSLGIDLELTDLQLPKDLLEIAKVDCDKVVDAEKEKLGCAQAPVTVTPSPQQPLVATPTAAGKPLARADFPELERRILTLPGARLHRSPGGAAESEAALPTFTIFFVYEEQQAAGVDWLLVGKDAFGRTDGWVEKRLAEDWRSMLVMQYAPPGQRGRVLFFERREDLADLLEDDLLADEIRQTYAAIRDGRHDDDVYVAIEPATSAATDKPYMMPILDWRIEKFADGSPTTLLQVAGLNLSQALPPDQQGIIGDVEELGRRQGALREFRIGVAFVIDTTSSMGAYISRTRKTVESIIQALEREDKVAKPSFALIGYRADAKSDPRLEYTARVFHPLDPESDGPAVMRAFAQLRPATAATKGWDEDAFAGLKLALEQLVWEPYDLRLIFLVTDAGARSGADPTVENPYYDIPNVAETANQQRVAIVPIHLHTTEATRVGNIEHARNQYRALAGATGDYGIDKYVGIETGSEAEFAAEIDELAEAIGQQVRDMQRGRRVEQVHEPATGAKPTGPALGEIFVNELFRAQLEYLARRKGVEAPRFFRAWAADRDLTAPTREGLVARLFLTRNQLSQLAQALEQILEAAKRAAETKQGSIFDQLQALAAETSVEGGKRASAGLPRELLPTYLKALPYRSQVLRLDEASWRSMGVTEQEQLLDRLRFKLRTYKEVAADRDAWIDLGAGDRGLDVYPINLGLLP